MDTKINLQNNVQFNGRIGLLKTRKFAKRLNNSRYMASMILNQNRHDVVNLTRGASEKRISMFDRLVDLYNQRNFYRTGDKEDSFLVNSIYKNIKKPNSKHISIISRFQGSFEQMNRVFASVKGSSKKLDFARKVNKEILSGTGRVENELLPKLLESENSSYYVENYPKIKSYLYLNRNNKNAVEELDEMVVSKTFNPEVYDEELKRQYIIDSFPFGNTENFNSKIFLENYSKPGAKFVNRMVENFYRMDDIMEAGADKYVADMYKTTTKKNIDFRIQLLNKWYSKYLALDNVYKKSGFLEGLDVLMHLADSDKHIMSYVNKVITEPNMVYRDIAELNEVLTGVSSKKLDIFKKNADNIISITSGEERIKALNENITNPFFETEESKANMNHLIRYGYKKKPSVFSKVSKYLKNVLLEMQDKLTPETRSVYAFDIPKAEFRPVKESVKVSAAPAEAPKAEEVIIKSLKPEIPVVKENKKTDFAGDVLAFAKTKLGAKTFERQQGAFGLNATKMRLNMLPEIFASIADTRKADRAVGKRRINSSNKDALNLYLKINGNNKKLVNYMLKKRNVDGTRMFEVKDIIAMIDKAEAKIKAEKKLNPNYRARDARRYYNHLQEAKVQQYGKLTRKETMRAKA